jgi:hypothetical protein
MGIVVMKIETPSLPKKTIELCVLLNQVTASENLYKLSL